MPHAPATGQDAVKDRRHQVLSQSDFFGGLSTQAVERMSGLCSIRDIKKKTRLFSERDRGTEVFYVMYGTVCLHKTTADGEDVVIRTVRAGELFAEVVLFEQPVYPVSAVALTDTQVLVIPKHGFLRLLDQPDFRAEFIAMLMRRQRYLADRVQSLAAHDVEERFFRFLREHFGQSTKITPDLSKKDMAAAIGASPETFSRLLKKLQQQGLLQWKGRSLCLSDAAWQRHPPD